MMYIGADRSEHPTSDFFDMEFNHLPIQMNDPNADVAPEKPVTFDEMKRLAKVLSDGLPEVRVDFYNVGERIYLGEMTFFHCAGFTPIKPQEWNLQFGDWIKIKK